MITKKRKGDADIVVIPFFIMFMVLFFSYYHINLFYHPAIDAYQRASVTFDFYDVKNSLEAAEIYLDSAHTYSLYQTLYENFKHSGYNPLDVENSGASVKVGDYYYVMRYNNADLPTKEWSDIVSDISTLFKEKIDIYLDGEDYNYLGIYKVKIPDKEKFVTNIQEVVDSESNRVLQLTSHIDKTDDDTVTTLELHGNHDVYGKINLKKTFSFERTYNIKAEALYEKAKEYFEKAKTKLQEAVTNLAGVTDKNKIKEELDKINTRKISNEEFITEPIKDGDYKITYTVIYDNDNVYDGILNFAIKVEVADTSQEFPVSKVVDSSYYVFQSPLFFRFYLVQGVADELPSDEDDTKIPVRLGTGNCELSSSALRSCKIGSECLNYLEYIRIACGKYGIEADLIAAIITKESVWNENAESNKGARGLMQIMPDTATEIAGKTGLDYNDIINEPRENILAGTFYFNYLMERFPHTEYPLEDRIKFSLASYNWGLSNVKEKIDEVKNSKGDKYTPIWDDIKGLVNQVQARPYVENIWEWYQEYKSSAVA